MTGLDWLDVGDVSTWLSYDQVIAGANGWTTSGWRYATEAEVCALFVAHADVPTCNFESGVVYNDGLATARFITHFTPTDRTFGETFFSMELVGLYDDGTAGEVGRAGIRVAVPFPPPFTFHVHSSEALPDWVLSDFRSPFFGSFLVRATPPEVPALPIAGVAVLAALLALAARRAVAS